MIIRSASYNAYQSISAALLSWGAQPAWVVDPLNGNDAGNGDPSSPLKTMGEFNARLAGNLITVPATLQLVGNVLDSPLWLNATRFGLGASLNVFGTRTDLASTTIASVTGLGNTATDPPWDITTNAGIDWTTIPVGSQLRLPGTSQVGWILEVLAANRIITSNFVASGIVTLPAPAAPTVSSTITAAALSRALPFIVNASGLSTRVNPQLILQNLAFDAPGAIYGFNGNLQTQIYACEMQFAASDFIVACPLNIRGSRYTLTGSVAARVAGDTFVTFCLGVVGTGANALNHQGGNSSHSSATLHRARLSSNGFGTKVTVSGTNIRNAAGPVSCADGAMILCSGSTPGITGSVGNTGIGIDCPLGMVAYFSTTKPTVTGASDCRVGGVARTYAQIPFINAQLNAIPPTVQTLTGNLAAIVQE